MQAFGRPIAAVSLAICAVGLIACGESSSEKATKKVCSATSEIQTQLKKLGSLPISSSFPTEAKASVEAIDKSINEIKEAAPNLPTSSQEELNAADKAFEAEIATITKDVIGATKSSSLETALKKVEPQIKASLEKVTNSYKKAFEALKC